MCKYAPSPQPAHKTSDMQTQAPNLRPGPSTGPHHPAGRLRTRSILLCTMSCTIASRLSLSFWSSCSSIPLKAGLLF